MASISTGGGEVKKGKPHRMNLRVDFTPMVDMNMLLITFFMFCTTLSKPQIMDIAMPTNDKQIEDQDKSEIPESKTITILLGAENKVYYYFGKPKYDDYASLVETTFNPETGLRSILLDRNKEAVEQMIELKRERIADKKMTEEDFNKRAKDIRNDKEAMFAVVKPTPECNYEDLVDALDEMAICSIGKYAVVELAEGDQFLIENLKSKGEYAAGRGDAPK